MTNRLKIFLWAAVHSPDFNKCYIRPPIAIGLNRSRSNGYPKSRTWEFKFTLRESFVVYVPWSVESEYRKATGTATPADLYDDIPF